MQYRVELKTIIANDKDKRYPSIETIKKSIDEYSLNERGFIVYHSSMHDYEYDLSLISGYDKIDSTGIIGIITESNIINDKLYLDIITNDNFEIPTDKIICFFRSTAKTTPQNRSKDFDVFNIVAVDIVGVLDSDEIDDSKLSEMQILS